MKVVVVGLSITSSWGNGHATTYRALLRELARRGHDIVFLERDVPWYAANRDLPEPPYCRTILYQNLDELFLRHAPRIREADCVIVGSYVPEGIAVGEWVTANAGGVTAFYDIDTPVTLSRLRRGKCAYLSRELIPRYHLYLSFTGGPTLGALERDYGAPRARALYCSVDPELHYPIPRPHRWDLGYLGTYSDDRQPTLERLLVRPALLWGEGRFVVAGSQYPEQIPWPANTGRIEHLAPESHREFYTAQRFTLNVTRRDMIAAGYSPSVRLFEAAACGVPLVSDRWPGLEEFFTPGVEILVAENEKDVLCYLRELPESERLGVARRARERALAFHSAARRAQELEEYLNEC
ncbi:CgeB family protein [Geomesophilobacter sediminis]|uniref:Glycosyltransferase n=1 Tax=Geomesophilobacter sediminis TaxID=2798584 RepID=A0A8J7IQE3_9BACT|nr:glycosyltransferase [Geomesophilobacter sediminis]MBJ6726078.1 glycosyltransferase [Geomesophilobacter sediminis]